MAQQTLGLGSNANDGNGDTLRVAMDKVNDNFGEIYASPLFTEDLVISGNEIRANRTNDDLVFKPSGTGSISFPAIRINDNNIEGTRSNDNINLVPNGTGSVIVGNLSIRDNKILSNASNADIELTPSGTGKVTVPQLTVDSNINIKDNEIKTTQSNSDLVLEPSGTGSVKMDKVAINGGTIDNTVIGATTPLAGTFTTLTANTSAVIDGVTITDNTISSNASNAELELTGNGSGTVSFNGLKFPIADGTNGQVLKTDGNGNLGFATASAALTLSAINDGTVTYADSSTNVIDTFATATYRSAKYFISISDVTNGRFEIVEANVIHGPSADSTIEAYVTVFGNTGSYSDPVDGDGIPLCTFTADIDDGNVRLLATNISSDATVFKFQRVMIDL
jgi:hypothetical protein